MGTLLPFLCLTGYAITPLTDTKPDAAPPPAMERVTEENTHLLEHKEVLVLKISVCSIQKIKTKVIFYLAFTKRNSIQSITL